uniref:sphingomyelin phosphodiesterase n=1 Tax=Anser cygnoides TaxID=8845 RepID=A0A8B9IQR3_ANSCY
MVLRESPFPSRALAALDGLAQGLLCPGFWALNRLLDLQPTTAERARGRRCCGCTGRALAGLACAALLLLSLPLTALGLLLWLPAQAARRPFACHQAVTAAALPPWDLQQRRSFTFVTANLCLLPSGLAKFSNLGQTLQRAAYAAGGYGGTLSDADFLCLQEVFDAGAAARLRQQLAKSFPHIVYDVGARGLQGCGLKLFGSGLFLASRYPLLAVQYHCYPNGAREDALSAKGLLSVQVLLASPPAPVSPCHRVPAPPHPCVNASRCHHVHVPPRPGATASCATVSPCLAGQDAGSGGAVVPVPSCVGRCPPPQCRTPGPPRPPVQDPVPPNPPGAGPWGLPSPPCPPRTLSQPGGRQQFLAGPILSSGQLDPEAGDAWQGRRVDYVLYRAGGRGGGSRGHPPQRPLLSLQEVERISFITQLASRSDHLPVALRLAVGPRAP